MNLTGLSAPWSCLAYQRFSELWHGGLRCFCKKLALLGPLLNHGQIPCRRAEIQRPARTVAAPRYTIRLWKMFVSAMRTAIYLLLQMTIAL